MRATTRRGKLLWTVIVEADDAGHARREALRALTSGAGSWLTHAKAMPPGEITWAVTMVRE